MRYESFYPFASQQQSPFYMGQQAYGLPPQMNQLQQMPRQAYPGNGAGPMNNSFGNPQSAQGGQGAQGASKLESYMATANQFLNTAQQFAPVVQQFAPMMQNLPAMWRLYKGFQSLPNASGPVAGAATAAANFSTQSAPTSPPSGGSNPRIFQPPGR